MPKSESFFALSLQIRHEITGYGIIQRIFARFRSGFLLFFDRLPNRPREYALDGLFRPSFPRKVIL